ncbi:MAG TPA: hypothetical protein VMQ45_10090 [Burkholderiaceae bacterium]|nr:hypothetical protein [Burkholderiaceae bacterium]
MIDALDPIEEIWVSPASPPEEVERVLAELVRVLEIASTLKQIPVGGRSAIS